MINWDSSTRDVLITTIREVYLLTQSVCREKNVNFRKLQTANDPLTLFYFTKWFGFGLLHHSCHQIPCVLGPAE